MASERGATLDPGEARQQLRPVATCGPQAGRRVTCKIGLLPICQAPGMSASHPHQANCADVTHIAKAKLTTMNPIDGTVIAGSFDRTSELHWRPTDADLPFMTPSPTAEAMPIPMCRSWPA